MDLLRILNDKGLNPQNFKYGDSNLTKFEGLPSFELLREAARETGNEQQFHEAMLVTERDWDLGEFVASVKENITTFSGEEKFEEFTEKANDKYNEIVQARNESLGFISDRFVSADMTDAEKMDAWNHCLKEAGKTDWRGIENSYGIKQDSDGKFYCEQVRDRDKGVRRFDSFDEAAKAADRRMGDYTRRRLYDTVDSAFKKEYGEKAMQREKDAAQTQEKEKQAEALQTKEKEEQAQVQAKEEAVTKEAAEKEAEQAQAQAKEEEAANAKEAAEKEAKQAKEQEGRLNEEVEAEALRIRLEGEEAARQAQEQEALDRVREDAEARNRIAQQEQERLAEMEIAAARGNEKKDIVDTVVDVERFIVDAIKSYYHDAKEAVMERVDFAVTEWNNERAEAEKAKTQDFITTEYEAGSWQKALAMDCVEKGEAKTLQQLESQMKEYIEFTDTHTIGEFRDFLEETGKSAESWEREFVVSLAEKDSTKSLSETFETVMEHEKFRQENPELARKEDIEANIAAVNRKLVDPALSRDEAKALLDKQDAIFKEIRSIDDRIENKVLSNEEQKQLSDRKEELSKEAKVVDEKLINPALVRAEREDLLDARDRMQDSLSRAEKDIENKRSMEITEERFEKLEAEKEMTFEEAQRERRAAPVSEKDFDETRQTYIESGVSNLTQEEYDRLLKETLDNINNCIENDNSHEQAGYLVDLAKLDGIELKEDFIDRGIARNADEKDYLELLANNYIRRGVEDREEIREVTITWEKVEGYEVATMLDIDSSEGNMRIPNNFSFESCIESIVREYNNIVNERSKEQEMDREMSV